MPKEIRGSTRSRFAVASTLLCSAAMLACIQGVATEPELPVVREPAVPSAPQPVVADTTPVPPGLLALDVEAHPQGPPPLQGTGFQRIYVMRTDGSGVLNLTPAGESARAPAFSPDGSRIAYESYHDGAPDIWIVRPDGTGRTLVARNATSPFWLDDTHLGYQCGTSLCAIRDDGSEQRTLLARRPLADAEDFAYRLSADGRTVVFTRLTLPRQPLRTTLDGYSPRRRFDWRRPLPIRQPPLLKMRTSTKNCSGPMTNWRLPRTNSSKHRKWKPLGVWLEASHTTLTICSR
jgi:hypothetical protein